MKVYLQAFGKWQGAATGGWLASLLTFAGSMDLICGERRAWSGSQLIVSQQKFVEFYL